MIIMMIYGNTTGRQILAYAEKYKRMTEDLEFYRNSYAMNDLELQKLKKEIELLKIENEELRLRLTILEEK